MWRMIDKQNKETEKLIKTNARNMTVELKLLEGEEDGDGSRGFYFWKVTRYLELDGYYWHFSDPWYSASEVLLDFLHAQESVVTA